jgi:hypothetical protein
VKAKIAVILVLVVPALALVVVALVSKRTAVRYVSASQDRSPAAVAQRVPVLVELFTSEGCSSCPPADELLTRLEQTQPIDGAEVIALSEHVDYWNRLGWTDPYSSSEFSARQNEYALAFDTDGAYTPQMVVDGRAQFVGSDSSRARKAIASAAHDSKTAVTVSIASEDSGAGAITFDVRAQKPPTGSEGDSADVLLAITESGLQSSVSRGENAGRRLSHTAVVRKLTPLGAIKSHDGSQFVAAPVVQIDKRWKRDNLKAVVFVQERASRRVLGAAAAPLGK